MSNIFSNSYSDFSYWFSETTLDNNGEVVSDINAGLLKLIPDLIDQLNNTSNTHKRFIVPDCQIAMPDIAAQTFYNTEDMWWYICLENLISNPFTEYKNELLYYAFSLSLLTDHDKSKQTDTTSNSSKIGKIIELN